jgi:hypothetical protein
MITKEALRDIIHSRTVAVEINETPTIALIDIDGAIDAILEFLRPCMETRQDTLYPLVEKMCMQHTALILENAELRQQLLWTEHLNALRTKLITYDLLSTSIRP